MYIRQEKDLIPRTWGARLQHLQFGNQNRPTHLCGGMLHEFCHRKVELRLVCAPGHDHWWAFEWKVSKNISNSARWMTVVAGFRIFSWFGGCEHARIWGTCHLELTIQTSKEHVTKIRRSEHLVRQFFWQIDVYIYIYTTIRKYIYININIYEYKYE